MVIPYVPEEKKKKNFQFYKLAPLALLYTGSPIESIGELLVN
jgi:hypothetical protein